MIVANAPEFEGFVDPNYEKNQYLSKIAAEMRSSNVTNVSYLITLGLVKGGKTFNGKVQIDFKLAKISPDYQEEGDNTSCLFIDYKGKKVKSLSVNGKTVGGEVPNVFVSHRVFIPKANQVVGENKVIIEFETSFVTDCEGFQYYADPGDNTEYIYTELEPDHCHKVFPCFDQPDMKA